MTIWAIVPVKPLRRGKSRLSAILTPSEREELNARLLTHTITTLCALPEIERVLVVSRDQEALAMARELGAHTVQEKGTPELNMALTRATAVAKVYTSRGILIVPADLPLLTPQDVRILLSHAQAHEPPVVVISPDRHYQGTNALLVYPAGLIEYNFGPDSFQSHCERARQAGAHLEIVDLPSLGLDVDMPEDLELVREVLESIDIHLSVFDTLTDQEAL